MSDNTIVIDNPIVIADNGLVWMHYNLSTDCNRIGYLYDCAIFFIVSDVFNDIDLINASIFIIYCNL